MNVMDRFLDWIMERPFAVIIVLYSTILALGLLALVHLALS